MPHTWFHLVLETRRPGERLKRCKLRSYPGGLAGDYLHRLRRRFERRHKGLRLLVICQQDIVTGWKFRVEPDWEYELSQLKDSDDLDSLLLFLRHDHYDIGPGESVLIGKLTKRAMVTKKAAVIDKVLINFKRLYQSENEVLSEEQYFLLVKRGVRLALQSRDPSLIETVIYCLGVLSFQYPQLMRVALSVNDKRVRKAVSWLSWNNY